jgi:predicted nucleotidyltransferase
LGAHLGTEWPAIEKSRRTSQEKKQRLQELFSREKPDSEDRSVVAFGSIGRQEWTVDSDLDWTLLIDGQADPAHLQIAQKIRSMLEAAGFKEPGRSGVFGSMAFSHEIIHNIGGEHDTNRNTTQRILLLLESTTVGPREDAYDRVIRGVLDRYLEEETAFPDQRGGHHDVPRFLLNDIVRFWRTMAVDFASKQRERGGQGWGLRNAKLRMSRKLIFVSGLLMCFNCALKSSSGAEELVSEKAVSPLLEYLISMSKSTPLEMLATALLSYQPPDGTARQIFSAYDRFLALLDDADSRAELERLSAQDAGKNSTFETVREISHDFQDGLTTLFFKTPKLEPLTLKYGVF